MKSKRSLKQNETVLTWHIRCASKLYSAMKAYPRFCYCGCWLVLPQKDKVQSNANQNAGEQPPGYMREQHQYVYANVDNKTQFKKDS